MRREDKIEAAKLKKQMMDSAELEKERARDAASEAAIKEAEGAHVAGGKEKPDS